MVDADDEPTKIKVGVARRLIDTALLPVASTAVKDDKEEEDGRGEKDMEGEAVPVRDDWSESDEKGEGEWVLASEPLINELKVEQDDGDTESTLMGVMEAEALGDKVGPSTGVRVPIDEKVASGVPVVDNVAISGVGDREKVCKEEGERLPPQPAVPVREGDEESDLVGIAETLFSVERVARLVALEEDEPLSDFE